MPSVKQTKTTTKPTEVVTVDTTSTTVSPPLTNVVNKVVKAKKTKTETPVPVVAPVATTGGVDTTETENVVVIDPNDTELAIQLMSSEFMTKLNQLSSVIASLKTEYKTLEKKFTKELKTAQKANSKRKRKSGNRAPSGFVKPTKISEELAKFLDKTTGTEMARTDVTREINKYIRAHNLQDKENGRKINPDAKLSTLLKLKKTDELTYFNLQRYMSPHFYKAPKDVVTTTSA